MKKIVVSLLLIILSPNLYAGDICSPKSRGTHRHRLKITKDAEKFVQRKQREQQIKEFTSMTLANITAIYNSRKISKERRIITGRV